MNKPIHSHPIIFARLIRNGLFYIIPILCMHPGYGQEIPAITSFGRADHHAGDKNWGFAEDVEGNLYVANTEGILIYNGMNWQKVHLPHQRVPRCIFQGYDGRIYAGGFETIGYIDRSDPSEPVFIEIGEDLLKGTEEEIWHITGNDHQILFQSFAIIIFLDEHGLRLQRLPDNIMFGNWIENRWYIPQIKQGIYVFENDTQRTIMPPRIAENTIISGIVPYQDHRLLLATRNQGLFTLDGDDARPVHNPMNDLLKAYQINDIIRLQNGDYALGTIQNGVYITDSLLHIRYHINKTNGLTNNSVLSLFETNQGALCIGLNIGMNILKVHQPDLFYYDVEGKLGSIFTAIYYRDRFYVGTNQGVFVQNDDGRFDIVPGSQGQVWSLAIIGEDLLCGHNSGTFQWINNRFELVSPITGGFHMQQLNDSQLLQSTYNGLILLEKQNDLWQSARRIEGTDKLVDRFVYQEGEVVGLHPYFGLVYYKLDLDRNQMMYRKIFQELETSIRNNALGLMLKNDQIIVQIDSQYYEVADSGSLKLISNDKMRNQSYPSEGFEYEILKPLNNNFEQNRLIAYFPQKNQIIRNIEEGYVRQFVGSQYAKKNQPALQLEYVKINGQVSDSSNGHLDLLPNEQNLTFQFRPAGHFLRKSLLISYRLSGYDNHWSPLPANGLLEFKQLNHGSYNLEVRHDQIASSLLTFTIYPHWYESWPGLILYLGVIALVIWTLNRRNKERLRKETARMQHEKEAALEAERIRARTEKLEHEVAYKSKMLANSAMTMVQKNNMLTELKEVIKNESLATDSVQAVRGKVLKLIDRNLNSDESWEIFNRNFAEVHEDFLERFTETYPHITPGDLRLAAYIRMNMSSKEIAPILQISVRSVENKRYRLRKKMNLASETNLSEYLMRF